MTKPPPRFAVTVRDEDIRQAALMHPREFGPRPDIKSSMEFAEWQACHAAGCDLWRWYSNDYPTEFKARVMAWHELHQLIGLHAQDAALSKRGRGKRG